LGTAFNPSAPLIRNGSHLQTLFTGGFCSKPAS
jgi:hypothetical protein